MRMYLDHIASYKSQIEILGMVEPICVRLWGSNGDKLISIICENADFELTSTKFDLYCSNGEAKTLH